MNKQPTKINQSTIKRISSLSACPRRFYLERISKELAGKYSDAMRNGHVFEYLLFGTKTREGEIPIMPRLKTGEKSTDQKRIEQQVDNAKEIFKKLGIVIIETDFAVSQKINDNIIFEGLLDSLGGWISKELGFDESIPWIFDIKLTKDCTSTFGDFAWGQFDNCINEELRVFIADRKDDGMDLLQPDSYMKLMELRTNAKWNFAYIIFDYKPKLEHKIIIVRNEKDHQDKAIARLIESKEKLDRYEQLGYPEVPTLKECKDCKALDCASRIDMGKLTDGNNMFEDSAPGNIPATEGVLVERPW